MIRTRRIGNASQRNKLKVLSHDGPRLGTCRPADESAIEFERVMKVMFSDVA
jgi:hypothetical protein